MPVNPPAVEQVIANIREERGSSWADKQMQGLSTPDFVALLRTMDAASQAGGFAISGTMLCALTRSAADRLAHPSPVETDCEPASISSAPGVTVTQVEPGHIEAVARFRREVQDKLSVASLSDRTTGYGQRVIKQCEDFLVDEFAAALQPSPAPDLRALLERLEAELAHFPPHVRAHWTYENPETRLHAILRDILNATR